MDFVIKGKELFLFEYFSDETRKKQQRVNNYSLLQNIDYNMTKTEPVVSDCGFLLNDFTFKN